MWNIAKWPVLLLIAAILYWASPNVKQAPKFHWMSIGALVAIVVWVLASVAFGFYVANFSSYNKTYGAIGGVLAFLLWLWITNVASLFGAELTARDDQHEEPDEAAAANQQVRKILYRPIGIAGSLAGGLIAKAIFEKAWQHAAPGDQPDPPKALETEYSLKEILVAAAIQGAIFALVKTIINRGGARVFEGATGEWPGG